MTRGSTEISYKVKHGIVDSINCKYSLPGYLSHFAAETLKHLFMGCTLGLLGIM